MAPATSRLPFPYPVTPSRILGQTMLLVLEVSWLRVIPRLPSPALLLPGLHLDLLSLLLEPPYLRAQIWMVLALQTAMVPFTAFSVVETLKAV